MTYRPICPPLIAAPVSRRLRASVIIPARNEQQILPRTLDALRLQADSNGDALNPQTYEIILLLNNCTDASQAVAELYRQAHPSCPIHIASRTLPPDQAHVGTARRLLMDTAYQRLQASAQPCSAILSTDADTVVAPDWIARNLAAIAGGADAVGGVIDLFAEDLEALANQEPGTCLAYRRDRQLQSLVAQLEAILDPDPADPWPRHLQHFGASLACTPRIYALAGGLPPVTPLEDVAFIDSLRKVGARIRHCPQTRIFTSARFDGRTEVGLSGQLRLWRHQSQHNEPHLVDSAEWIEHRFRSIAALRRINETTSLPRLLDYPPPWRARISALHCQRLSTPRFLELLDCNALIEELFTGCRHAEITTTISALRNIIARL